MAAVAVAWGDVAVDAAAKLSEAGIPDAQIQARRLVEQASGYEGGEYYIGLTKVPAQRQMAYFDSMLARRLAGEPLQYVLGRWGFRGLDLMVNSAVLIPRPETETLAGLAVDELARRGSPAAATSQPPSAKILAVDELARRGSPGGLVVDLGTGSGAVGLAVATECETAQVVLTDVCADALAVARANMAGLGRAAARISICQGSWFEALPGSLAGSVDVVVSNPPYIRDDESLPSDVVDWEPSLALRGGPDGLDGARCILEGAPRWLSVGGCVLLELSPDQMDQAASIARAGGLTVEAVHSDLSGRQRVLQCRLA